MKKVMMGLMAAAMLTTVFAQKSAPKEVACPVMPDHKVDIKKATKSKMFADHEGRRYFFCCAGCKPAFAKDPAKYKKSESIPTPKVKKK